MKKELEQIRKILKIWNEHQKSSIAEELKNNGEDISIEDFSCLPENDKWKWYCQLSSTAAEVVKKESVRRACFLNDAANSSLNRGELADAIGDMAAAEWSIRLSMRAYGDMSVETAKMELSKIGAIARHVTTYALRGKIVAHWRKHIGADKSNEFAAELLQKQFPEVSHRTLARYVAEAKKLPPADTL